jgi:hypothetical protein
MDGDERHFHIADRGWGRPKAVEEGWVEKLLLSLQTV